MDVCLRDTSKIVTGGNDKNVTVFNKDTGQVVSILEGHAKKVTSVLYHPEEVRFLDLLAFYLFAFYWELCTDVNFSNFIFTGIGVQCVSRSDNTRLGNSVQELCSCYQSTRRTGQWNQLARYWRLPSQFRSRLCEYLNLYLQHLCPFCQNQSHCSPFH